MIKKIIITLFISIAVFSGFAGAVMDVPVMISGNFDGDFSGYAYIDTWESVPTLTNGVASVDLFSCPIIFGMNGDVNLISGRFDGLYDGYKWNGTGWENNATIINGLFYTDEHSAPTVFNLLGSEYLISGRADGLYDGYKWNGTGWENSSSIIGGLTDLGGYSSPTVFNLSGSEYLISGRFDGLYDGYKWNGTGWENNATITNGLTNTSLISAPTVFNLLGSEYLISGRIDGLYDGYKWNGTGWENSSSIVEGLADIGGYSSPSVYVVSTPAPVSPTDLDVFNVDSAPYTELITFVWDRSHFYTTYNIQIATDPSFQTVIKNLETTGNTVSYYLYRDDYYWRVRGAGPWAQYGEWSETFTFSITVTPPSIPGNNIYGVVYESTASGYKEIGNAIVTISNDTYYDSLVTASTGYYFFDGLANNTTYYIVATKDGYENSQIIPVTTKINESINKDIILQLIEGQGQYYENHYVRFIVTDTSLSRTYAANIKIFEGDSTTSKYDKDVGADGAASFLLDQQLRYRIETTYDSQTQIDYITPSETEYYIFLEWIDEGTSFLPAKQFYQDVNITITKNDDTGQVSIYYNDSLLETNSLKFQIGQVNNNGTFILIDESAEFLSTDIKSHVFTVTDYVGEDYQVRVIIDHDSFGKITKTYGVSFPGSNLPFGRGVAYLCVFILMITGMQFSANDCNSGAILICGLASLMWYMDIFNVFGAGINTLMGVGLGMAVIYSILKYINDKRMTEGL